MEKLLAGKTLSAERASIDRYAEIALLYDFYGPLLTEKQCGIIEMYFMQNFSLSEIAEILNITKQAASILLNRTIKLLISYEGKLKLSEGYKADRENREKIRSILNEVLHLSGLCDGAKDRLKEAVNCLLN